MNTKMKFVSLFAGIGGFDLGLERAGHECIGQVEIDKKAKEVLTKQWKDVLKHGDVKTAKGWADEIGLVGKVDIVCGGFPCQDVSVAGRRAGIAGARSGLFQEALEFAKHVQAKYIILENVPGLLSSNNGRDFGVVISEMANAGFSHIEWRILDSQFFGVAQRRRRVFIIGSTIDRSSNKIFVESESMSRNINTSNQKGQDFTEELTKSIKETIENKEAFGESGFGDFREGRVSTLKASGGVLGGGSETLVLQPYVKSRKASSVDDYETWVEREVNGTLNTMDNNGDTRAATIILSGSVRRLTPVECERLQGFPDGWTEGQSDTQRYKQIGNAVTVNVIEWIGKRL